MLSSSGVEQKYREVEEQKQISWCGSVANRSNSDVSLCGSDASHVDRGVVPHA